MLMGNKSSHLTFEERYCIEKLLKAGCSSGFIAQVLNRGRSTISEEISMGGGKSLYEAKKANNISTLKQRNKKRESNRVLSNKRLQIFINSQLEEGLSPEVVAKKLKEQSDLLKVSAKVIRNYIKISK